MIEPAGRSGYDALLWVGMIIVVQLAVTSGQNVGTQRVLIHFIDPTRDFGLMTPLQGSLGGAQSALCYLARELAQQGHQVSIANACADAHFEEGVRFYPWKAVPTENGAPIPFDVIVVLAASAEMIRTWHHVYGEKPLWLMWVHHDIDQPAIADLKDPSVRALFDFFLFVSEWQAWAFHDSFGIGWDRAFVLRNGVSPAFHQRVPVGAPILPRKSADPVFLYTSTPYRGLDCLLDAVPLIRARVPEAQFKIFSSWQVYGFDPSTDPHQETYQRCRDTEGVSYIGSVSQTRLAEEMDTAWGLAYPNTFNETACISVMEALAVGAKVITTHRAALPETAAGLATLIVNPQNREDFLVRFADAVVAVIEGYRTAPEQTEIELQGAVAYARTHFSWRRRAEQLTEWLNGRLKTRAPVPLPAALALVEARQGRFLVSRNDAVISRSLSLYGDWAAPEIALLLSVLRPGDVVLDIGSHIGTEAVPMARAVGPSGQIYAFEPQTPLFRLLEANLALNGCDNVRSFRTLVGSSDGDWGAASVDYSQPTNFGAVSFVECKESVDRTPMVRVDTLLASLPQCRLIKIDVEGMEPDVLAGAEALIARCRPIIYCEATQPDQFDTVVAFLAERNYAVHWHAFPGFSPDNYFGVPQDIFNGFGDSNLLCLPRESGLFSDLPPALFFEDLDRLYPGLRPGPLGPSRRITPPPSLLFPPSPIGGTGEPRVDAEGSLQAALVARTEAVPLLRLHRDLAERHGWASGDRAGPAVWLDLLAQLAADFPSLRLLEIGVFRGQTLSLWSLIAKGLGLDAEIVGLSPLANRLTSDSSLLADPPPHDLAQITDHGAFLPEWIKTFSLDAGRLHLIVADSGDPRAVAAVGTAYHLVYLDGDPAQEALEQDIAHYGETVVPGGFLVIGDPLREMPGWFRSDRDPVGRARASVDPAKFEPPLIVGTFSLHRRRLS